MNVVWLFWRIVWVFDRSTMVWACNRIHVFNDSMFFSTPATQFNNFRVLTTQNTKAPNLSLKFAWNFLAIYSTDRILLTIFMQCDRIYMVYHPPHQWTKTKPTNSVIRTVTLTSQCTRMIQYAYYTIIVSKKSS